MIEIQNKKAKKRKRWLCMIIIQWVSRNLFDEYKALSDAKKIRMGNKYDPINLFLETYNYVWFGNEESTDF